MSVPIRKLKEEKRKLEQEEHNRVVEDVLKWMLKLFVNIVEENKQIH